MVSVNAAYDEKEKRVKFELFYDDEEDPKITNAEIETMTSGIARFAQMLGQVSNPIEFLRGVIADIEDGNDMFSQGFEVGKEDEEITDE